MRSSTRSACWSDLLGHLSCSEVKCRAGVRGLDQIGVVPLIPAAVPDRNLEVHG